MCGRFTHLYTWKQLHRLMRLTSAPTEFPLRYNVAPTQTAPVVRASADAGRRADMLRWGLIPPWAKDAGISSRLIIARAETIAEKPAFRQAFQRRRCLVPISGFYEWQAQEGSRTKQPYYITASDGGPLAVAGIWESWRDPEAGPDAPPIESFAMITTGPNEMMARIHDRMPVIIDPAGFDRWLDPANSDTKALAELLRPYPSELMLAVPVSTRVNSPKGDDPAFILPVSDNMNKKNQTQYDLF